MKIKEIIPKNSSRGWELLFGDEKISYLMSQISSAIIQTGILLENKVKQALSKNKKLKIINDLVEFEKIVVRKEFLSNSDIYFFESALVKNYFKNRDELLQKYFKVNPKTKKAIFSQPDFNFLFLIKKCIYVVELKLGTTFDTKKIEGEKSSADAYIKFMQENINNYNYHWYFCSFLAKDINEWSKGVKNKIQKENLIIGKKLCDLIGINYDQVLNDIQNDQIDNIKYVHEIINEVLVKKIKSKS